MPLFDRVAYHIPDCIPENLRRELGRILDANGATDVAIGRATHIISDTVEFEGVDSLSKSAVCVTSYWVNRCMELGSMQDPKYFSSDKEMIFSGVVATSADLPSGDKEFIIAGIKESGGQWREGLTRDVTHLFVTHTQSEKYHTAMHFRESAHIIVLLPQWFDQCWTMQMRLPHDVFEFPEPAYMRRDHDLASYKVQLPVNHDGMEKVDKSIIFNTVKNLDALSSPAHLPKNATRNIWQGRVILLSTSLSLDVKRREALEARIRRNGGVVVTLAEDENEDTAVERADVFVTQYRTGAAYSRALRDSKTIGTLAWLFYVERSGVVSSPRDQLLHFPVRDKPIENFSNHEITVTNYEGDQREYIKKLIDIMGAKFTATMTGRNTIVIAAYKGGNKTKKAEEWSVPIVTHKWLEDCFVLWRNLTPAQQKYIDYAPGVNYGTVLGERGVGHIGLVEDPELPPEKNNPEPTKKDVTASPEAKKVSAAKKPESAVKTPESARQRQKDKKKNNSAEEPTATATSQREAREVDEVEDALDLGNDNEFVDEVVFTPKKIGPPHGVKKTPTNAETIVNPKPKTKPKPKPVSTTEAWEEDAPAPATRKGKEKEKDSGDEDESEDEDVPPEPKPRTRAQVSEKSKGDSPAKSPSKSPAKSPAMARPRPKSPFAKKPVPTSDVESESDPEEIVLAVVKKKPPPRKAAAPAKEEEEEDVPEDAPKPKARPKPKPPVGKKAAHISEDEDDVIVVTKKPSPRKASAPADDDDSDDAPKVKPRARPKPANARPPPIITQSNDEASDSVDETPPRVVTKSPPKTYKSKAKAKAIARRFPGSDSDDSAQEVPAKKSGKWGKSPIGLTPSPARIVSVELPDPRDILNALKKRPRTPERKSASSPTKSSTMKPKPPVRTTSIRAAAYEAPSPLRGRATTSRDVDEPRSPSPPPRRAKPIPAVSVASTSRSSLSPPPQIQRTPSRRSAAAAASQRLREEVMPDVMNYEKEVKRGGRPPARRRKTSSSVGVEEEETSDGESNVRAAKKRKLAPSGKAKGKGKAAAKADESDVESVKFITHVRSGKRSAPPTDDEDDEPGTSKVNSSSVARKKVRIEASVSVDGSEHNDGLRRSSMDPKKIRILKTKVEVREEVIKALMKLGVKFTEKPAQCTHLVASSFARTEKFLCALSNAPFVLSTSWLLESAAKKVVLAEDDYLLKDPAMEEKHGFKLVEALKRARVLKNDKEKLLQGHFFYFTPNVPVGFTLMRNVIQANGGECIQQTPTLRNLSSTRHVVSCAKDEKLWRPLAKQGFPIYSQELILMAACAQFVDWDGESKRVPVS